MIGCLRTRVRKQQIIALYFESEKELQFYKLEASDLVNSYSPVMVLLFRCVSLGGSIVAQLGDFFSSDCLLATSPLFRHSMLI